LNQGYKVTGSDLAESDTTKRLAKLGAKIHFGHQAENITGSHVVVISSAVRQDNPELKEARRIRVPVIPRAEMLGELMRGKTGIAVAGSHGKTTTTSMLATVLTSAGLDPTIVIGGKVDSLGGNAKLGQGKYVVAEADESDGSFLHLPATYAVVTNIDNDHLDHYKNLSAIEDTFLQFVGKLPFYGKAAVCGEDRGIGRCLERFSKPITTYGLSKFWDFYADDVQLSGLGSEFDVYGRTFVGQPHEKLGRVKLNVPGNHNVLNALAAITIGLELKVPFAKIVQGLSEFRGVDRRFQIRYKDDNRRRVIVDDYGHHPTEIMATLQAARNFWPGRIITVFQPHRYSRTLHCRDGFLAAFRNTDVLYMSDIYAAGEDPIPGVDAASLCADIAQAGGGNQRIEHVGDLAEIQDRILREYQDGDMILCMGAGSITRLAEKLAASIQN
ncbi:MAG: UDP-N-acetylmuramate--L-alanine ligase, partial [Bdellovibrionia bacterium]